MFMYKVRQKYSEIDTIASNLAMPYFFSLEKHVCQSASDSQTVFKLFIVIFVRFCAKFVECANVMIDTLKQVYGEHFLSRVHDFVGTNYFWVGENW